jgi:hypothetical protein
LHVVWLRRYLLQGLCQLLLLLLGWSLQCVLQTQAHQQQRGSCSNNKQNTASC